MPANSHRYSDGGGCLGSLAHILSPSSQTISRSLNKSVVIDCGGTSSNFHDCYILLEFLKVRSPNHDDNLNYSCIGAMIC